MCYATLQFPLKRNQHWTGQVYLNVDIYGSQNAFSTAVNSMLQHAFAILQAINWYFFRVWKVPERKSNFETVLHFIDFRYVIQRQKTEGENFFLRCAKKRILWKLFHQLFGNPVIKTFLIRKVATQGQILGNKAIHFNYFCADIRKN